MGVRRLVGFYIVLFCYWLFFYRRVLMHPYSMAHSELLEYDFGILRLAGEYWKKGELPHDDYYYDDFIGVRPMLLYPPNILVSIWMAVLDLDRAFVVLLYNVLVHILITSFLAFNLFNGGLVGLFGALAWTYMGYHQQQSITRTGGFLWLTATLLCLKLGLPVLAGISLGLMVLIANPPYTLYFCYCLGIYGIFKGLTQ